MARRRQIVQTAPEIESVPAELTNHEAATWSDPGAFRAWCRANLDGRELTTVPGGDDSAYHRFTGAAEHWAEAHGLVTAGEYRSPDWAALAEHGVQRMRRLRPARTVKGVNSSSDDHRVDSTRWSVPTAEIPAAV